MAWLLGGLGVVVALFVYSRTKGGAAAIGGTLDEVFPTVERLPEVAAKAVSRGLRNNNPGNIREAEGDSTFWLGERATDDDSAFEEFTEMKYGVRAAARTFRNYQRIYGLNTVRQLIGRWAPPNENNTALYIQHVCERMHTSPDTSQDLSDFGTLSAFLRAVFREENGIAADAIADATMVEGISLA